MDAQRVRPATWRRAIGLLLALACGLTLAACGSSGDGGDGGAAAATQDTAGTGADVVARAREAADQDREGTDRTLPTSGPRAARDKLVWIVAANMATEGSRVAAEGAEEAGRALGWRTHVVDARFDPATAAEQIRSAISARADAILLAAIDCAWAPGALREAKAAGVLVYSQYGLDCDEPLFDGELWFGPDGERYQTYFADRFGPAAANHLIAETDGRAKIIQLRFDEIAAIRELGESFAQAIEENCPDCETIDVPISGHDMAQDGVQPKVATALTREPDADAVFAPFDGLVLVGTSAAVGQAAAQGRDLQLVGVGGYEPNLRMVAEGGPQTFTAGLPNRWGAWAAMDGLNRLFAGEDPVDPGIGLQAFDVEHPPSTIPYDGNERSAGWEDGYRAIWKTGSAE